MKQHRSVLLASVMSLVLVAASCGSDSKSTSDATSASTTPAAETSAAGTDAPTTTAGASATTAAAPSGDLLSYDESATCGDAAKNTSNFAKIEAVDPTTVKFTLCSGDVAFPSKVAFSAFQIQSSDYLDKTGGAGDILEKPIGTGP